ncbi:hypothetical protein CGRA01v4_03185 [Colletotrichum graminicola]|nr:hypothetical protein CGRA01v4_03185 [Colletotrichum graminicola]
MPRRTTYARIFHSHVHLPLCLPHTSTHHRAPGDVSETLRPKHMTLTTAVMTTASITFTSIGRARTRNEPHPASIHNEHLYKDGSGLKHGRSILIFFIMVGGLSSSPNALV